MKRGLVLAGGGAKGAYEVGVLQYLVEKGWSPKVIAGTSIGAFNAALLLTYGFTKDGLAEITKIWKSLKKSNFYKIRIPLSFESIADNAPLRNTVEKYVDIEKVLNSKIKLFIATTILQSMEEEIISNRDARLKNDPDLLSKLIVASMTVPVVFSPEIIGEYQHVDGAAGNSTPLSGVIKEGCDQIITIVLGAKQVGLDAKKYSNFLEVGWRAQQASGYNTIIEDINRANGISDYIRAWEKMKEQIKKIAVPGKAELVFKKLKPCAGKKILDIRYVQPQSELPISTEAFGSRFIPYVMESGRIDAKAQLRL